VLPLGCYEIEQALRADFSTNQNLAARQRLALAHMEAEATIESRCQSLEGAGWLYTENAVVQLHQDLFSRLPAGDLLTPQGQPIQPGKLRERDVQVGQHVAPSHESVPAFIQRWGQVYGAVGQDGTELLAMAAAHHRLCWVHPFIDGNGRVMRLHTHAVLVALGYTQGFCQARMHSRSDRLPSKHQAAAKAVATPAQSAMAATFAKLQKTNQ
jgi:Fic family protein